MEYTGLIEINWSIIMIWITVLVLFLVLKKFFFEKIYNFVEERKNSIQDAFDNAEKVNKEADMKLANYEKQIADVEAEGRAIIRNAKIKADEQAKDILEEAQRQASQLISKAEKTIEIERVKAIEEMRQEITRLVMLAAQRVVEREIDIVGQEKYIDEVIEKSRRQGWQS